MMNMTEGRVDRLEAAIERLIEAQTRTEQRIEELAQAQARTEKGVEELAQAQARTEKRIDRLEVAVEQLIEAQARTEKRVEELAQAQVRTEKGVEELTQAQVRTEKGVEELAQAQARTEKRVEELAQAQARTEKHVDRLEAAVKQLIEAQARTEKRVEELAQALTHLVQRVDGLTATVERIQMDVSTLKTDVAALKGSDLERKYRQHAGAFFGRLLRRPRAMLPDEMEAEMYDEVEARLTSEELDDLLHADVLVRGRPKHQPDAPPVWLVVEVSSVIDSHDVARAQRRADALRKAGYRAIPTVTGERATTDAEANAAAGNVLVVQDGSVRFWEEALRAALAD